VSRTLDASFVTAKNLTAGVRVWYSLHFKFGGTVAYGPFHATAAVNDASVGDVAWTNASDATVSNDTYATAVLSNQTAQRLKATGFGFNVPTGKQIQGIKFELEGKLASGSAQIFARAVKAGTVVSAGGESGVWSSTEGFISYGNDLAQWGATWAPEDINAANFGFCVDVDGSGALTNTLSVDSVRATVYASNDLYIGSHSFSQSGINYIGAASDVGEYMSSITPRDGAFAVKTMRVDINNFPLFSGNTRRFTDYWREVGPEGIEVDAYQWLEAGGPNLPELLFKAVMRPIEYDPHHAIVELVSISEKYLEKKEVSFPINSIDFPNADLDDIGKRANIVIGSVKKAVAHAVLAGPSSTVRATMGTGDTAVPIHDEFYDAIPASGIVQVGNEKIAYTSKSGSAGSRTLNGITRGYASTAVESHLKDDTILQVLTNYVYLAAGRAMKSISRVYVKRDRKEIPLAPSQYAVTLANTTLVSGKTLSLIEFAAPPLIAEKDFVGITDNIGVNDGIAVGQSLSEATWTQGGSDQSLSFLARSAVFAAEEVAIAFPAQEKTKSSGNFTKRVSIEVLVAAGTTGTWFLKGPSGQVQLFFNPTTGRSTTVQMVDGTFWGMSIRREFVTDVGAATIKVSGLTNNYLVSNSVTKTGTVSKTGTVTLSSQSSADLVIGDAVLFDGEGCADDGSGTYTGTPSALIEKPADVLHFISRDLIGIPASLIDDSSFTQARTDSPSSYKFGFVISERTAAKELLLAAGMQSRIRVDWPVDKIRAQFLKSTYGAVTKTVTQENIIASGSRGRPGSRRTTLKLSRGDANDIINVVSVYYARQWHKSRSRDGFEKVTQRATNAASVTKYGEREQADRFWFDFIPAAQSAMAEDVRDFWVNYLAEAPRVLSAVVKLDQYELLPGDLIGVSYYTRQTTGAGTFPYTFPITFGEAGDIFDGLNGEQKWLLEEVRVKPGNAAAGRSTGMFIAGREVQ
jgi:hypothetical protein